jgi:hypothetical protein
MWIRAETGALYIVASDSAQQKRFEGVATALIQINTHARNRVIVRQSSTHAHKPGDPAPATGHYQRAAKPGSDGSLALSRKMSRRPVGVSVPSHSSKA